MTKAKKVAKIAPTKSRGAQRNGKAAKAAPAEEGGIAENALADAAHTPAAPTQSSLKQPSKQERLADMLVRDEGATLDDMVEATGWLKHTVRAALTGLKKKGFVLSSDKVDGVRTYRAAAPE